MTKFLYIANVRLPTPRAHGLQIMKMCEAFADAGAEILLAIPDIKGASDSDPYAYYGVRKNFVIRRFLALDWLFLGFFGYWLRVLTFAFSLIILGRKKWKSHDVIFSRDIFSALLISYFRRRVFFEMHDWPPRGHWFWGIALRRLDGIISTNSWKAEKLHLMFGIPREKILACPNGFDPNLFKINDSQEILRKRFNLPVNKKIVLYSGQLYGWKGVDIMAEAARLLPEHLFVFVGGAGNDLKTFKNKYSGVKNIMITGQRPYSEIPRWLKAADILVLPNSAKSDESRYATSPIKLFEYMASGVPIASSDLPSIREIVSEKEVYFFEPDNPVKLAAAVKSILQNYAAASARAANALEKSWKYSWEMRAKFILSFVADIAQRIK